MSETQSTHTQDPSAAQTPQPAPPPAPAMPAKEIEGGKAFAILSYVLGMIGIPFFLVPLIMRNNEFSLYHAKQCLMLWIAGIVGLVVSGILTLLCIGPIIAVAVSVFCLVLSIIGLINASKGEAKPLPVLGPWGEDWFKGLKKV